MAIHSISVTERADVVSYRHESDTAAPVRRVRAHLGEEPVVRMRSCEGQLGILDRTRGKPCTERWRRHPRDGVRIREQHVGGDTVGVELLVPDPRVVRAL